MMSYSQYGPLVTVHITLAVCLDPSVANNGVNAITNELSLNLIVIDSINTHNYRIRMVYRA